MKILSAMFLTCSISCFAQSTQTAKPHPSANRIPDAFAKMSLKALLAIKSENCNDRQAVSATDLLINDVSVEATSKIQTQVVKDLETVQATNVLNSKLRGLRLGALQATASLHGQETGKAESSLEAYYADPIVVSTSKQDGACQGSLEAALRKRIYSPLPASCTDRE
jgi:hypothetical protein